MSHGEKCSHDENRKKICGPCGRKIICSNARDKPEKFLIGEKTLTLIKKFVSEDYDLNNEKYPLSICRTCYLTLLDHEKKIYKRQIQIMPKYSDIIIQKETRSVKNDCNCFICSIASSFGHMKVKKGKGHFRVSQTNKDISEIKKLNLNKLNVPQENKQPESIQLCSKCFQKIGKGISHDCKNPKENLLKLVEQLPEKNQEQVASAIIKDKYDKNGKALDFDLATGGRKRKLVVNNNLKKELSFSNDSLDSFRVKISASQNQMRVITNFMRCNVGRKSIPKGYKQHMSLQSKVLSDLYKVNSYEFDCEGTANKQERPVVFANAEELLNSVIENRKLVGNCIVKVMADSGQGFFKISLTILPENYSPKLNCESTQNDEFSLDNSNEYDKRSLYSEGGTVGKKSKLTSVDKLILLCIVPQIKESYDNVKLLVDLTKLNNISFKFVADFKLLLIINGQQTATSMYPCPYCFVSLRTLRGNESDSDIMSSTVATDASEINNCMQLKTYGNLRADYKKYCLSGKNKKFSMESHSTVNPPIFDEDDDVYVLQKCIIPELHILQGFANHLFWNGLVGLVGKEKALLWPKKLNLISKNYHGDAFEGNACRTLLKEADKLLDPEIYEKVGIYKLIPYVNAFKEMNKIVDCCFTSGKIGSLLDTHIKNLHYALKSIDKLTETLKIHIILSHIKESLLFIDNNNGLGYWSEQSGESIHRDFMKFWKRYSVTSIQHKSYSTQLLKAVVEFSSLHL